MFLRKSFLFALCMSVLTSGCVSADDQERTDRTPPREFDFGGLIWRIKSPQNRVAPGPNFWGSSTEFIWQDDEGLHLSIAKKNGRWHSTEIFTRRPTGYGTYTFTIDADIDAFDPNIVAGFFTWDTHPEEHHREIDIEIASWGEAGGARGHFVIQPAEAAGNMETFALNMQGTYSTHRIIWTPHELTFSSYHGAVTPDAPEAQQNLIHRWSYDGVPPSSGSARFRINLWLFRGRSPKDGAVMTVRSFEFIPWIPED